MSSSAEERLFASTPHAIRSSQKSAITNGTRLLPGIDNRSPWVRRCRDIMGDLTSDRGGASELSAAEASLIRRAATISVELESLEVKFAARGQASERDLDLYTRTSGNLRRILETLGIQRRSRNVSSIRPLDEIVAELDREKVESEAAE